MSCYANRYHLFQLINLLKLLFKYLKLIIKEKHLILELKFRYRTKHSTID